MTNINDRLNPQNSAVIQKMIDHLSAHSNIETKTAMTALLLVDGFDQADIDEAYSIIYILFRLYWLSSLSE